MADYHILIIGLAVFYSIHVVGGVHAVRQHLINVRGFALFRMLHALVSLLGLFLIVVGYSIAPINDVWMPSETFMRAPFIAMPISLFLLSRMKTSQKITRHPMLWGVAIWAAAHLVANGDERSVILFGSFLLYAFLAMWLADRRRQVEDLAAWQELAAKTSVIPFVALLQKRAEPITVKNFMATLLVTGILYVALIMLHPYFTGIKLVG